MLDVVGFFFCLFVFFLLGFLVVETTDAGNGGGGPRVAIGPTLLQLGMRPLVRPLCLRASLS